MKTSINKTKTKMNFITIIMKTTFLKKSMKLILPPRKIMSPNSLNLLKAKPDLMELSKKNKLKLILFNNKYYFKSTKKKSEYKDYFNLN
jgi:hypothetical protein